MSLPETRRALEAEIAALEAHIRRVETEAHAARADARVHPPKVLIELRTLRDVAREGLGQADLADDEDEGEISLALEKALKDIRSVLRKSG
jgi:hypothetical protein